MSDQVLLSACFIPDLRLKLFVFILTDDSIVVIYLFWQAMIILYPVAQENLHFQLFITFSFFFFTYFCEIKYYFYVRSKFYALRHELKFISCFPELLDKTFFQNS